MCVGVPALLESCDEISGIVNISGVRREISMMIIDDPESVKAGDWVLVHAGYAVTKLDPEEAQETLKLMENLADAS